MYTSVLMCVKLLLISAVPITVHEMVLPKAATVFLNQMFVVVLMTVSLIVMWELKMAGGPFSWHLLWHVIARKKIYCDFFFSSPVKACYTCAACISIRCCYC